MKKLTSHLQETDKKEITKLILQLNNKKLLRRVRIMFY